MQTTYIAFLRAINVGGHTVSMDKLRGLFTKLGFTNVRSYIQSGNVFFNTIETDRPKLTAQIESHLTQSLEYPVAVFLRTIPELETLLSTDPFQGYELTDNTRFYLVFTSEPLPSSLALPIDDPKQGICIIGIDPVAVSMILTLVNGRPANSSAIIEKKYKLKATSRFLHTTVKILEAAKQMP